MELLEENSKNNVSNIYTQEIKKDSDSPNRIPPRPQTNEFKIPPRARDGKTFSTDLTQKEMLEKMPLRVFTRIVRSKYRLRS